MSKNRDYKSYLLRLWRTAGKQWEPWQAMLEDPHTGERHGFASMEALFKFLQVATGGARGEKARSQNAAVIKENDMLLSIGDRGQDVSRVQQALQQAGFEIVVDGIFGPGTETAVKAFQEREGLIVDGIVGPNTLGALGLHEDGTDGGAPHDDDGATFENGGTPFPDSETADWAAFKAEVVRLANQEWNRWHDGGKQSETDPQMTAVLQDYYRTGVEKEIAAHQLQDPEWQEKHPWSAVFISWVMRTAGAGDKFHYARAHQGYVAAAKRNRERNETNNPFWAFAADEIAPEVGDLVCAERSNSGATYENIDDGFRASHCDIVTEVRPGKLTVIGGNVGDTVGRKTSLRIDEDGLIELTGSQRRYFAVLRIRTDV